MRNAMKRKRLEDSKNRIPKLHPPALSNLNKSSQHLSRHSRPTTLGQTQKLSLAPSRRAIDDRIGDEVVEASPQGQ